MTEEISNFLLHHCISQYERSKLKKLQDLSLKDYKKTDASSDRIVNLYKDTVNKESTRRGFKSSEFKS